MKRERFATNNSALEHQLKQCVDRKTRACDNGGWNMTAAMATRSCKYAYFMYKVCEERKPGTRQPIVTTPIDPPHDPKCEGKWEYFGEPDKFGVRAQRFVLPAGCVATAPVPPKARRKPAVRIILDEDGTEIREPLGGEARD
ncbi:MAG: hypothetical protein AAF203_10045 [Pseudomonadota bacterium]